MTCNLYVRKAGFFPKVRHHYVQKDSGCSYALLLYCTEGRGWYRIQGNTYTGCISAEKWDIIHAGFWGTFLFFQDIHQSHGSPSFGIQERTWLTPGRLAACRNLRNGLRKRRPWCPLQKHDDIFLSLMTIYICAKILKIKTFCCSYLHFISD